MATVDYMVAAYGEYSASATGGNALARDVLAGAAAMYSGPSKSYTNDRRQKLITYTTIVVYNKIGSGRWHLFWPSLILTILAFAIAVPVYIIYWKGPAIRKKSNFACQLAHEREKTVAASRSGTLADPEAIAQIRRRFQGTDDAREPHHLPQPGPTEAAAASDVAGTSEKENVAEVTEMGISPSTDDADGNLTGRWLYSWRLSIIRYFERWASSS